MVWVAPALPLLRLSALGRIPCLTTSSFLKTKVEVADHLEKPPAKIRHQSLRLKKSPKYAMFLAIYHWAMVELSC